MKMAGRREGAVGTDGRHLYSVDTGIANNVQALDLSDNVVSSLNAYELVNVGLANVRYLNLTKNSISEIDLFAFDGLVNLTVLDLTKNYLHSIPNDAFVQNKNLQIVYLSKNNFKAHVPKLRSSSITELSLDFCQISHFPSDTFIGLPRLRRLNLANNLMIQMSRSVVQMLTSLKKISLEGNPWSCNKELNDLDTHLVQRGVEFQEICGRKNPKKFEKMVMAPVKKEVSYHQSATTVAVGTVISKRNLTSLSNNQTRPIHEHLERKITIFDSVWLLILGFIFGMACGLISSYVWLSRMYSRCRRQELNDIEINARLQQYFHHRLLNNSTDNNSLTDSRPGTPPPSYLEVILGFNS
ncbi:uncharacterized protein LOC143218111 isoform X2 [Lasioglossum baleicum]|uniref:uncharacterized protein LOC143218111 isoform X2 n=1 Tax=Lasioglossum baleicum TaxID=434251 RepID=UPI003FCC2C97